MTNEVNITIKTAYKHQCKKQRLPWVKTKQKQNGPFTHSLQRRGRTMYHFFKCYHKVTFSCEPHGQNLLKSRGEPGTLFAGQGKVSRHTIVLTNSVTQDAMIWACSELGASVKPVNPNYCWLQTYQSFKHLVENNMCNPTNYWLRYKITWGNITVSYQTSHTLWENVCSCNKAACLTLTGFDDCMDHLNLWTTHKGVDKEVEMKSWRLTWTVIVYRTKANV